jgi:hypothetical protein
MFAKDDIDFIKGRLVDTIISHNKEPSYVIDVNRLRDDVVLTLAPLKEDLPPYNANIDDADLRPVPLGFVNFDRSECRWFSRVPHRAWKQGMTMENTVCHGVDIRKYRSNLRRTIIGDYPKFTDACKKANLTAFHRDFAVKGKEIYYKDLGVVGVHDKGTFTLKPEWFYLQEYLHEVML